MAKRNIPRQAMPELDPEVRRRNFEEVALGYTPDLALSEAERCLQCRRPTCVQGCPVQVDIPVFILALREGDMRRSARALKRLNNLPAICGRVCPQETQCEETCVLAKKGEPVAIGRLERYVADWERLNGVEIPEKNSSSGKKIAVVGSGPAGLTAAADLARYGHEVVLYESLHEPGGVLTYGIPEFRLPKAVVRSEVDFVRRLGVDIRLNSVVGKLYNLEELLSVYDAVFIGTGAGLPQWMNIPGENINGVYSANEFLTRVNLMKAYRFPEYDTPVYVGKRVAVVGAGNVAMDSCRCALRLGAEQVYIIYRRSAAEVPARAEEVGHAKDEGVQFEFLTNPVEILRNDKGWVKTIRCVRMALGEPGADGRRLPYVVDGSEFDIDVDMVIMALGTRPNPLVFSGVQGLERTKHGIVIGDENTGRTSKERVWAGGDALTGAATVISAMGAGKRSAADINAYLQQPNQAWR